MFLPYRRHPRLNETGVFRLIVNLRVDLVTCEPKQHHSLLQLLMSITGCNTTLRLARHGHRSVKFTHRRREERRAERGIAGLSWCLHSEWLLTEHWRDRQRAQPLSSGLAWLGRPEQEPEISRDLNAWRRGAGAPPFRAAPVTALELQVFQAKPWVGGAGVGGFSVPFQSLGW